MSYTKISKPTGADYTRLRGPNEAIFFDDTEVDFDSDVVFFDGASVSLYTNVSKPTGSVYTNIAKPT